MLQCFNPVEPNRFFSDALGVSFDHFGMHPEEIENAAVIEYISKVLADFVPMSRFVPTEMRRRFDTIAGMYAKATSRYERILMGQQVGDFALFASGMFPESLDDVKYYEQAGSIGYLDTHSIAVLDPNFLTYALLAENFPVYRSCVTHARDMSMSFVEASDGSIRIAPVPEPRYKGVQQQNGSMKFTFYLPEKMPS